SRLRALLQNMPQGVHVADVKTGRFTWANGALLELLGYDWQEIEALSVMDLHPPEVHQLVTEKFQQSLHDKSPFTVQVPVKRKDGAIRTVMLKSAGLQLDGRDCAIAIFTDITQRVKAENTLHTAHLQLEQVLARLNDSAGEVQRALLVNPPPHACPRLDVASRVVPAENVGGDFCDFMPHREECLDLVVGDVMGKGMASGLVAASIVGNCLRIIAGMLMNSARPDWIPSPSEIVESLHSLMARELIVLDKFASLCYARVVPEKRQAALVNCGHQQTIHYCAARGVCELVENTNMPIGFAMREHYLERRLDIDADDILVFYSDGITEARAPNRKMFGVHRLIRTVEKTADESAETIMDAIFGKLTSFSGDEQQRDDRMCIVIKVRSVTSSPPRTIVETTVDSTPEQLRTLRKKLGGALKRPEFKTLSAKDRQLLLLAVQEAGSNIIQHAYGGASGNPITLCLDLLDRALRVTLIHKGIAFMGKASKQPEDMDDFQETGYGLQIIENAVDNYRFFTDSTGKNCICLTKHMQQARARTPEKNVRLSAGT
ncbi:MAG: SpoIIE family protein phosphatase, partial [Kiritimatiellales bacterium]|nr:SpoIIE family protein phosphatase [Kiritimatiellales bacterium]